MKHLTGPKSDIYRPNLDFYAQKCLLLLKLWAQKSFITPKSTIYRPKTSKSCLECSCELSCMPFITTHTKYTSVLLSSIKNALINFILKTFSYHSPPSTNTRKIASSSATNTQDTTLPPSPRYNTRSSDHALVSSVKGMLFIFICIFHNKKRHTLLLPLTLIINYKIYAFYI